jgi:DNA polymerase-3 subunit delta'
VGQPCASSQAAASTSTPSSSPSSHPAPAWTAPARSASPSPARGQAPAVRLALDLLDLFLSRLARTGLQGPPPEAAQGEAATLSRLAPHDRAARAWAEAQARALPRARLGKAVNLDPAALLLDILLDLERTAHTVAAG